MFRIPLTQGKFAIVDREDFERLSRYKWYAAWNPSTQSYRAARWENGKNFYMSWAVLSRPPSKEVDHKNLNTLDNRKENLRISTPIQNTQNRRRFKNNTSGLKGVRFREDVRKWQARITVNKKRIHLGYFTNKELAGKKYDEYAIKYFGEFARPNFGGRIVSTT